MIKKAKKANKKPVDLSSQVRAIELLEKYVKDVKAYVNTNIQPSPHRKGNQITPGVYERDYPRFTRENMIQSARQYVEEFPFVAGMFQTLADNIIGSGYRLNAVTGDKGFDKEIESRWNEKKNFLDIRKYRTWGQLQRLWFIRSKVDGDVGIYNYVKPDGTFCVQTIEAERIRQRKFDYLDQGLKLDEFGAIESAFIGPRPENQMDWEKIMREGRIVDGKDFCLYAHFPSDRADQIRGTSALLQNFNLFRDIAEVMEAVIIKIKNQAFMGLVFQMESTYGGSPFGTAVRDTSDDEKEKGKSKRLRLNQGMVIDAAPGEKVELLGMNAPNAELMPFLRFLMRYCGTAFGLPLEMLLMDPSETNFSGMRTTMELAKKRFRVEQDHHTMVTSRVYTAFVENEVKNQGLKVPQSIKRTYLRHNWGRPSAPYMDVSKEASANDTNLKNRIISPQMAMHELTDLSPEQVLDQWSEFNAMCAERGITIGEKPQEQPKDSPEKEEGSDK